MHAHLKSKYRWLLNAPSSSKNPSEITVILGEPCVFPVCNTKKLFDKIRSAREILKEKFILYYKMLHV